MLTTKITKFSTIKVTNMGNAARLIELGTTIRRCGRFVDETRIRIVGDLLPIRNASGIRYFYYLLFNVI